MQRAQWRIELYAHSAQRMLDRDVGLEAGTWMPSVAKANHVAHTRAPVVDQD